MSPGLASRFTPGKHLSVAFFRALWYICNSSMLPSHALGFIALVMAVLHKALVAKFKSVPASARRTKFNTYKQLWHFVNNSPSAQLARAMSVNLCCKVMQVSNCLFATH